MNKFTKAKKKFIKKRVYSFELHLGGCSSFGYRSIYFSRDEIVFRNIPRRLNEMKHLIKGMYFEDAFLFCRDKWLYHKFNIDVDTDVSFSFQEKSY